MAIETPRRRLIERSDSSDLKCAGRDETEFAEIAPASNADFGLDANSEAQAYENRAEKIRANGPH
jgi:hypothetical protein